MPGEGAIAPRDRLIVALDIPDVSEAERLVAPHRRGGHVL